jgi:single-strand DNA-binding protein
MASLNKVILIGNVGNDPEMRYTPDGKPVTSFNLAVSRRYTTREGERREETEWFTVVTWNRLAETCNQFLARGRRAYVEGRLRSRVWEGQDGQKRFRNEVIANKVVFLDRQPVAPASEEAAQEEESEELPQT